MAPPAAARTAAFASNACLTPMLALWMMQPQALWMMEPQL
jgi:hypothetical protein